MILLRAAETARRLNVAVSTVYYLAKTGALPHVRFSDRAIRFPSEEIDAWVAAKVRAANRENQPGSEGE